MEVHIHDGNISIQNEGKLYRIELESLSNYGKLYEVPTSNSSTEQIESNLVEWDHKQWFEFFMAYIYAMKKQQSGKLHSIIESFGGTEQEIKARKSVTFQLLRLGA